MPGFRKVILSVLNLLCELIPYETSENRVSLELHVQGLCWFCCSRDSISHNDSSHSCSPTHRGTFPTLTTSTAWQDDFLHLCRYPHDLFFLASCLSLGNRHHLSTASSPALILSHPALPNTQPPSLNICFKGTDCVCFLFVAPFKFCYQMSLKYHYCCLNALSSLYTTA